jgi:radical SAM superfamily enzyme YgiQ (UPF0313 family)
MKVKLLYLPRYDMDYNTGELLPFSTYAFIPPVGMPIITAFLKNHNIKVEQDDLLIKTYRKSIKLLELFTERSRVNEFLKKGNESKLEEAGEKILKLTKINGFDVIGFSLYEPDNPTTGIIALVIAKLLKEKYDPMIVIGGRVWGYMKEELLKSGWIDYGLMDNPFTLPGELAFFKFCEAYEDGKDLMKSVPGLEYMKNGKLVRTPTDVKKEEIVHFTRPCFDGLPLDLYKYRLSCEVNGNNYSGEILALPYFFIKGCPNRCAFCCNSILPGWIVNSPEKVAEDLAHLKKKYKTNYFFFLNTTINPTYKYAEKIADALKNLDIKFSDSANFVPGDSKLWRKLAEAGAVRLMFGLESGSPKILKLVGKNFNLKQAERELKNAWKAGIWSELSLICGFPHERDSDTAKTIDFLRKNMKYIKSAYINKFFLDGQIRQHPERYGIKIRGESYKPIQILKEEWRGGFDEIGGLKWEKRRELTEKTFYQILEAMNKLGIERGSQLQEVLFMSSLPEWKDIIKGKYKPKIHPLIWFS